MSKAETFALVLIVLCVAALGIGVIVEASKYVMLRSRRTVTIGRKERRRQELEEAEKRANEKDAEADKLSKQLESLNADRLKTLSLIKTVTADRVEMVHELGAPDRSRALFMSALTPSADFTRIEERRIMFHRDIWKRRNTALVWADSLEEAQAALDRVFTQRSAVAFTPPKLHPDSSTLPAPDPR